MDSSFTPQEDAADVDDPFFAFEEPGNPTIETILLPEDVEILVLDTVKDITAACDLIVRKTRNKAGEPGKHVYIGFDYEWSVSKQKGRRRNKVTLLQVAFKKKNRFIPTIQTLQKPTCFPFRLTGERSYIWNKRSLEIKYITTL
ncbi:hypothetical protein [Parasitella parasitica]|uniref:Uncharacterized protein n=1 Tax=Parasitella parasitica TaxID=35722 RepID=A0A0B7N1P9_9FUNG|nr:hypothetical protein [Parasitella parasitica]